jgi:hypothetical protein
MVSVDRHMPRRMLLLVAGAEILGMTLWFSATAAAPSIAGPVVSSQ